MRSRILLSAALLTALIPLAKPDSNKAPASILNQLATSTHRMVPTVPATGDQNPYGVAFVPQGFPAGGLLQSGDILVSNFNDGANTQGTGTTIMRIDSTGQASVFFQGSAGLGLTTALGVLRSGFVLVGNLPTQTTGMTTTVTPPGSLLLIDGAGHLVQTFSSASLLDGPWDLTIHEDGVNAQVFVSNVLSGTVTRLDLKTNDGTPNISSEIQIASGYATRTDPTALVVGPTGLAYDVSGDVLFVASTGDNTIYAVDHARSTQNDNGKGRVAYHDDNHLRGPLGLALAPNGHLISANGDAQNPGDPTKTQNFLVEFTPGGTFVAQFQLDMGMPGGAFGLAIKTVNDTVRFAAVDDDANNLNIWDIDEVESKAHHD